MDKGNIIAIVIGVLLVALVIGGVVYDASIDTCILTINDIKYEKADFEKFLAVAISEKEKSMSKEDADAFDKAAYVKEMYEQYVLINEYYAVAKSKGATISTETQTELDKLAEEDSEYIERITELGVSKEEYIEMHQKSALANEFVNNISNYYTLPEGTYDNYIAEYPDIVKTYDYRIMQVVISKDEETGEAKKDEARTKAQEALDKVKAGESFEETAKTYGSYRLVSKNGAYTLVNGELESVPAALLADNVTDTKLYEAIVNAKAGTYTEIIENEDNFVFAYVENVRDELDEEGKNQIVDILTTNYAGQLISSQIEVVRNEIMLKRVECPDLKIVQTEESTDGTEGEITENTDETTQEEAHTHEESPETAQ